MRKSVFVTLTPLRCGFLPGFCRCALCSPLRRLRPRGCVIAPWPRAERPVALELSLASRGRVAILPGALGRVLTAGRGTSRPEGWLGAPEQLDLVLELPPAASVPLEYWKTCWAEDGARAVKLMALLCQSAFRPCHINLELPHSVFPSWKQQSVPTVK